MATKGKTVYVSQHTAKNVEGVYLPSYQIDDERGITTIVPFVIIPSEHAYGSVEHIAEMLQDVFGAKSATQTRAGSGLNQHWEIEL